MSDEYTIAKAIETVIVAAGYKRTKIINSFPEKKLQNHPNKQVFIQIVNSEMGISDTDTRGLVTILITVIVKSAGDPWGVKCTKEAFEHKTVLSKLLTEYRESAPNQGYIQNVKKSSYPVSKNQQWVAALTIIFVSPFEIS